MEKGVISFSFQWRLLLRLEGRGITGSRVFTPIGISWLQTTTSGLSTTRGVARACGGWRRSASKDKVELHSLPYLFISSAEL